MAPARSASIGKRGFTLLEVLLVLALTSLSAALLLPNIRVQIEQANAHSESLKFQQQVMDLRRKAFHEAQGLRMVSSGEYVDDETLDPPLAEAQLSPGWSYRLSTPLDIDSGGRCAQADVEIVHGTRVALRLQGQGPTCAFLRTIG